MRRLPLGKDLAAMLGAKCDPGAITGATTGGNTGDTMAENTTIRPIIKKKKNVQAAGHHGGAWKVAYADFVTAMMAFFLLMWLLNATTEEQRQGIAAYFNPGIPAYMATGGGDGMFNGEDLFTEMTENQSGTGASDDYPSALENAEGDTGGAPVPDAAEEQFSEIESLFRGDSGESTVEDSLLKHVNTRVTDEGLIIEIFDLPDTPLFAPGSDVPTEVAQQLLMMIANVTGMVRNDIAIGGHLGRVPESDDGFTLSAARAQKGRLMLAEYGIAPARFVRVTGQSNRALALETGPDYRNRRLEITLLRSPPG